VLRLPRRVRFEITVRDGNCLYDNGDTLTLADGTEVRVFGIEERIGVRTAQTITVGEVWT